MDEEYIKNGAEAHTMVTVANGYTTIQCCTILTMHAGNWGFFAVTIIKKGLLQGIQTTCE